MLFVIGHNWKEIQNTDTQWHSKRNWMIYTILQSVGNVSVLTDLINEDAATIIGILKGGETRHIQKGFEVRTAHIIG